MTSDHFKREMSRLALAYGQEPNAPQWLVYWDRLQTTGPEVFAEAVTRIIDSERFFPTVATMHGYCDRVRAEMATRAASDPANAPRLRPGTRLPVCASCNDAGWISVANGLPNLPSKLEKCPDCGGAVKGSDPLFHSRQADAYAYHLDRERATYPPLSQKDGPLKEVADRLRHKLRPDEDGAASRWTPPMPKAGAK